MSSLVCDNTTCVFTRVDTDGYAFYNSFPYSPYPNSTSFPTSTPSPNSSSFPTPVPRNPNSTSFPTPDPKIPNSTSFPTPDPMIPTRRLSLNNTMEEESNETIYPSYGPYVDDTTAPWTDTENQDMLSDTVAITRDYRGGIFNAQAPYDFDIYNAPFNTEWALLPQGMNFEEGRCQMRFCSWYECFAMYNPDYDMVGKPGVLHLIEEDVYYNIKFTSWTSDNEYQCYDQYCESPFARRRRMEEEEPEEEQGMSQKEDDEDDKEDKDEDDKEDSTYPYPISLPPYPPYNSGPGGGFSYIRDAEPFALADDLPECPKCDRAKADPAVLKGAADDSFVDVTITGVTPENVTITIKAVSQDQSPRCNSARFENATGTDQVRPNAKFSAGDSTVQLRRTRTRGLLDTFRYTIYFDGTSDAGTCSGQVPVCVPVEGFGCDDYLGGYDATATGYCDPYGY